MPLEPRHLDVPGTEMVLIANGDALASDLGARLDPAGEQATMAALRQVVKDASGRPPSAPLLEGIWH